MTKIRYEIAIELDTQVYSGNYIAEVVCDITELAAKHGKIIMVKRPTTLWHKQR